MSRVVQGTRVRMPFTTVDDTGALFDASAISVVIMAPDATKTTITLAGGGVIRVSLGSYYFLVLAAQASTGGASEYVMAASVTLGGYVKVEVARLAVDADPTL